MNAPESEERQELKDTPTIVGGERQAKQLQLIQLAQQFGYDGEPGSIAELTQRTWPESLVSHEVEVINEAHRLGLISETCNVLVIDSFRAVLQMSQNEPRDKPYRELMDDFGETTVLEHWEDVKLLLGIDDDTTQAMMDELERAQIAAMREGKRGEEVPYFPRVSAGSVPFESQEAGNWGKGFTW